MWIMSQCNSATNEYSLFNRIHHTHARTHTHRPYALWSIKHDTQSVRCSSACRMIKFQNFRLGKARLYFLRAGTHYLMIHSVCTSLHPSSTAVQQPTLQRNDSQPEYPTYQFRAATMARVHTRVWRRKHSGQNKVPRVLLSLPYIYIYIYIYININVTRVFCTP